MPGVPFATDLRPVRLVLDETSPLWRDDGCLAVAADSRGREGSRGLACASIAALARDLRPESGLVKKIDSLLRGHAGAEIAVLRNLYPDRPLVIAPAFPRTGRTTRGGVQHVRGIALHESGLWAGEPGNAPRSVMDALAAVGPVEVVLLSDLRQEPGHLLEVFRRAQDVGRVPICDAETDADLDAIVRAGRALGALWVGSGGLTAALARARHTALGTVPADAAGVIRSRRPIAGPRLAIVGSASPVALRQAQVLADVSAAELVRLDSVTLAEADPRRLSGLADGLLARVQHNRTIVVTIGGSYLPMAGAVVSKSLARVVAASARAASVVVLTGGATARAVLDAWGIPCIDLVAELEPGVVLACPPGDERPWLVTKAGSFGDDETLARAMRYVIDVGGVHE